MHVSQVCARREEHREELNELFASRVLADCVHDCEQAELQLAARSFLAFGLRLSTLELLESFLDLRFDGFYELLKNVIKLIQVLKYTSKLFGVIGQVQEKEHVSS